jgi:hypothetical protein
VKTGSDITEELVAYFLYTQGLPHTRAAIAAARLLLEQSPQFIPRPAPDDPVLAKIVRTLQ